MINDSKENVKNVIMSCLENVGIDFNLINNSDSDDKNILKIMDSLQYISFISELEDKLSVVLVDEFLIIDNFSSFQDFIVKVEYYVKGWKESCHNIITVKGGENSEIEEAEKDVT